MFARLNSEYSVAVRAVACRCISAISGARLRSIVNMVLQRLRACRGNIQLREYAIVQKSVAGFQFSFHGKDADVSIYYFNELSQLALKVDRGVLRAEICSSLKYVLTHTHTRSYTFAFVGQQRPAADFAYRIIYEVQHVQMCVCV